MKFVVKYWWWFVLAFVLVLIGIDRYTNWQLKSPGRSNAVETISYRGNPIMPRGIRNNNPGNLVITGINWDGKIPIEQNTDGQFEQFWYYWQGVRAMIKDIINDITQDGTNTIRLLIYRYAPPYENATQEYIDFVSDESGYPADTVLSTDAATLYPIVRAMAHFENGEPEAITQPMFNYAYNQI